MALINAKCGPHSHSTRRRGCAEANFIEEDDARDASFMWNFFARGCQFGSGCLVGKNFKVAKICIFPAAIPFHKKRNLNGIVGKCAAIFLGWRIIAHPNLSPGAKNVRIEIFTKTKGLDAWSLCQNPMKHRSIVVVETPDFAISIGLFKFRFFPRGHDGRLPLITRKWN